MKKVSFIGMALMLSLSVTAQVGISTDGSAPNSSAMLDISSSNKGLLLPRMTTTEQSLIANPAPGLIIFNTDSLDFYGFNGNVWLALWDYPTDTIERYCGDSIEYGGQWYTTVQIGSQCWMAENLATTKYNDGTDIPLVTGNTAWGSLTTPGYCWYNNDSATYGNTYGAIYNWYTVNTGNLCPTGWHVSTDGEWTTLTTYLGGESVAGGKLKETGTTHWNPPNTGATNETGFTALPGGRRGYSGTFGNIGNYGFWWSATEFSTDRAWYRIMYYDDSDVGRGNDRKKFGFSVRCLRD